MMLPMRARLLFAALPLLGACGGGQGSGGIDQAGANGGAGSDAFAELGGPRDAGEAPSFDAPAGEIAVGDATYAPDFPVSDVAASDASIRADAGGDSAAADGVAIDAPPLGAPELPCKVVGLGIGLSAVARAPSGNFYAVASAGGFVLVLGATDGAELRRLMVPGAPVWAVDVSPDGGTIAAGDDRGRLHLWSAADGRSLWSISAHDKAIVQVAFSPDGRVIAASSFEGGVRLFLAADGARTGLSFSHATETRSLAFSPDGTSIATGGYVKRPNEIVGRGEVAIWQLTTGAVQHRFPLQNLGSGAVAFSPSGELFAHDDFPNMVVLRRRSDGMVVRSWESSVGNVGQLAFSADGVLIANAGRGGTSVRRVADGSLVDSFGEAERFVRGLALSPDGRDLVVSVGSIDAPKVERIRIGAGGARLWQRIAFDRVGGVELGPSGQLLTAHRDGNLRLWDRELSTLREISVIRGDVRAIFSPDGSQIFSSGTGIHIWRTSDGSPIAHHQIEGPFEISLSRDGTVLAGRRYPNIVSAWNVPSFTVRHRFVQDADVFAAILSDDGRLLASADRKRVVVRRVADGGQAYELAPFPGDTFALAFSPDSQVLVTAGKDGLVRRWRTDSGALIGAPLSGHEGEIYDLAFSGDGRTLASGGADRMVRLWRMPDGSAQAVLAGAAAAAYPVAVSADGQRVYAGPGDGTLRVWCRP